MLANYSLSKLIFTLWAGSPRWECETQTWAGWTLCVQLVPLLLQGGSLSPGPTVRDDAGQL
jgi:hypothetical protein